MSEVEEIPGGGEPQLTAGSGAVDAPTTAQMGTDARSGLGFVLDVPLRVTVEIGSARMLVAEVLQLDKGSVVELDRAAGEPADVFVNGRLVARGEVTLVEDHLAVRILDIVGRGAASSGGG